MAVNVDDANTPADGANAGEAAAELRAIKTKLNATKAATDSLETSVAALGGATGTAKSKVFLFTGTFEENTEHLWTAPAALKNSIAYVTLVGGGQTGEVTPGGDGAYGKSGQILWKRSVAITPSSTYRIRVGNAGDSGTELDPGSDTDFSTPIPGSYTVVQTAKGGDDSPLTPASDEIPAMYWLFGNTIEVPATGNPFIWGQGGAPSDTVSSAIAANPGIAIIEWSE